MEKKKKVIVIGGGFSGLAAAALCAKNGYEVVLYEKNDSLGGRARVLKENGFTFDMGPSWYLMPEVFEKYFGYFGKKSSDFYELVRLDPHYRVYYENAQHIEIGDDISSTIALFDSIEPGSGAQLQKYIEKTGKAYGFAIDLMYLDIFNSKSWFSPGLLRKLSALLILFNQFRSWDSFVSSYFKDLRLKKILEFTAVFLGGSPYNTPALYAMLGYADLVGGVWYPRGGMGKVVSSLETLALEKGVSFQTGRTVQAVVVEDGVARGVLVDGVFEKADAVLGAMDLGYLETMMLEKKYQSFPESYWRKRTLGISAVLLYVGLNKKLKNIRHHMLYFTDNWKESFEQIFTKEIPSSDVSFYVSARSVTDASVVPDGCDELMILIPVASKSLSNEEIQSIGERVLEKFEEKIGEAFRESIIYQKVYGPDDFTRDYFATSGTALGLAHTLTQSLWGRPGSVSKKVKGLFYAGQFTNPGVGVPTALISGELAARRIHEYLA